LLLVANSGSQSRNTDRRAGRNRNWLPILVANSSSQFNLGRNWLPILVANSSSQFNLATKIGSQFRQPNLVAHSGISPLFYGRPVYPYFWIGYQNWLPGVETYLQLGLEDKRSNMLLELAMQILKEPCFNVLRTQEQLGYIVFSGVRRAHGVQGNPRDYMYTYLILSVFHLSSHLLIPFFRKQFLIIGSRFAISTINCILKAAKYYCSS
jgi:hypothetical protein